MFECGVAFLCGVIFQPILKVLYNRLFIKARKED